MLAFKQWKVAYSYTCDSKERRYSNSTTYVEKLDYVVVSADSAVEARKLVLEASKTGVFDWYQHTFCRIREECLAEHAPPLILSERAIRMIQKHIPGSYIEQVDDEDDFLPLERGV